MTFRIVLVYQYKCSHCGGCYTGETICYLSTQINEHLTGRPMPTEVTTHIHEPQRKDFTIALRTVHTKIGEAIVIKEMMQTSASTPIAHAPSQNYSS